MPIGFLCHCGDNFELSRRPIKLPDEVNIFLLDRQSSRESEDLACVAFLQQRVRSRVHCVVLVRTVQQNLSVQTEHFDDKI